MLPGKIPTWTHIDNQTIGGSIPGVLVIRGQQDRHGEEATKRKAGVQTRGWPLHQAAQTGRSTLSPWKAPPTFIHITEGNHSTYVAHIWVSEVLHYPPPRISFLLLPWWKRWRQEQGLPPSHSGDGQPFPKCGPQAAASVALGKLLAMQILRPHPRLTLAGLAGGSQEARGLKPNTGC